ncbi:unnamed protein product, partial [Candidula unifasciata]
TKLTDSFIIFARSFLPIINLFHINHRQSYLLDRTAMAISLNELLIHYSHLIILEGKKKEYLMPA